MSTKQIQINGRVLHHYSSFLLLNNLHKSMQIQAATEDLLPTPRWLGFRKSDSLNYGQISFKRIIDRFCYRIVVTCLVWSGEKKIH